MVLAKEEDETLSQEEMVAKAMDPGFWRELAPQFTVEGEADSYVLKFTKEEAAELVRKMDEEAYVHVSQPGMRSSFDAMQNLLTVITNMGLPPVFAFAYDEFWNIHLQVRELVKILLEHDFAMLPDFWSWRVEPGQAGWEPHRDKIHGSLFPDGKPKSITLWVSLSVVHPLNSCIYVLPANLDGDYKDGQTGAEATLADMRALPGEAGDIFAWTQRVYHWGSRSAGSHDLPPRQSIAFEYQRSDVAAFNSPLLDPDTIPDFKSRMALIAKQVLEFTHMYQFTPDLVTMAKTILDEFGLPEATGKSL